MALLGRLVLDRAPRPEGGQHAGPRGRGAASGRDPSPDARERFAHPIPRIREGEWLARHGVHAAIDISDGLVGDAAHIAAASGVRR